MNWEEREILLIVTTYPERSKKYGNTVCTAGILEDTEEWVRLYPINFNVFNRNNLKKFTRFRAKIHKDKKDRLKRKESYKIDQNSIKIIDDELADPNKKAVWDKRFRILEKKLSPSLEDLKSKFYEDRTSLGIIKPLEDSIRFSIAKPIEEIEIDVMKKIQLNLYGEKLRNVDAIEKAFSYEFKCGGRNCNGHKIICEDWELLQAFRSWRNIYISPEELEEKIRDKFYNEMIKSRELYFIMGTYWKYPTWLIIGLFYPPKQKDQKITDFFI